jgi:hypothetical protein
MKMKKKFLHFQAWQVDPQVFKMELAATQSQPSISLSMNFTTSSIDWGSLKTNLWLEDLPSWTNFTKPSGGKMFQGGRKRNGRDLR